MRRIIAAGIAVAALGGAMTGASRLWEGAEPAEAAQQVWTRRGQTYVCHGSRTSVTCSDTRYGYGVVVAPGWVAITYAEETVASCLRRHPPRAVYCVYQPW